MKRVSLFEASDMSGSYFLGPVTAGARGGEWRGHTLMLVYSLSLVTEAVEELRARSIWTARHIPYVCPYAPDAEGSGLQRGTGGQLVGTPGLSRVAHGCASSLSVWRGELGLQPL